tara:strand:+ start:6599 stop:7183 length:585 start_codon:yes stop_codon:yes gene_type:complete
MGIISRAADTYYTYRFLKTLVTPWNKMKAYELGLIDENGKKIRSPETPEEKSEYSLFHRLVFNIKRILNKLPFGKSRLASYAAALFLLKEHTGMNDEQLKRALDEAGFDFDSFLPEENKRWYQTDEGNPFPGEYKLTQDMISALTGDIIAKEATKVLVHEGTEPVGYVLGEPVFEVDHKLTKQKIYVSIEDITR